VRGADLHLAEMGEGDDVVLCLHGWPQLWYEWRALMPALADRHRVIALDQRGFGWSEATAGGYEKEELAADVLALLDELGLERVKLVGHDWGGYIGFLLGLRAPERFQRYLALNIVPPWASRRAMAPHLWRFWYQWLILAPGIGQKLHTSGTFTEPERARAAVQMYRVFNLQETPEIVAGRYADAHLEVPTLMLFGTGDSVLRPEMLAGWRGHAPDMEVELVEGCGHFIADEAPYLVAARAREFFA
jgi:pimeloyl-ACP methyl ester carboxylesterase